MGYLKRYNRYTVPKLIQNRRKYAGDSDMFAEAYKKEQHEKLASMTPEDIIIEKDRRQAKHQESLETTSSKLKLINLYEKECLDLYEEIFSILSSIKSADEIEQAMKDNAELLAKFEKADINLTKARMEMSSAKNHTKMEDLFSELAKVFPEYVRYAPISLFDKNQVRLARLTPSDLIKIENKIIHENPNLFKDETFVARYGKYLPSLTGKLMVDDDLAINLVRFPDNYRKINKEAKEIMIRNGKLHIMLSKTREPIKYMPVKDIYTIAGEKPYVVGLAILEHPEVLERIAEKCPKFFVVHSPKVVFRNNYYLKTVNGDQIHTNKNLYINTLDKYIYLFPELQDYFGVDTSNISLD